MAEVEACEVVSKDLEDTFYLEQASLAEESTDGFEYNEVPEDDADSIPDSSTEEDYKTVVKNARENRTASVHRDEDNSKPVLRTKPEVIEDFVCNYLARKGMNKTLDCFQTEWYELKERQMLKEEDRSNVPDVYVRNRQLDELVGRLELELQGYKEACQKAKDSHLKLRKERDFHRMHHKRVLQEKDKLISDLDSIKQHYASYEPTLKALQQKYESATKEKMLAKLERDRAIGQMEGFKSAEEMRRQDHEKNEPKPVASKSEPKSEQNEHVSSPTDARKDSEFPPDRGVNPLLGRVQLPCPHLTRSGGFRLTSTVTAHALAISSLAVHPRKEILATASDDKTWKLWTLPEGEIVMTGEGHLDWLADCDFSPCGTQLATASGDGLVKIWNFMQERCVHTFKDHTQAVWGSSWHWSGDFVASCSMDGTSKIWDLNSLRCRATLRGHEDSVNSIEFLHYSNIIVTCSADKTISLWDARTSLCGQTFYGHVHSINNVTFNMQGDKLASCDSYGAVKLWDIRSTAVLSTLEMGPHPANQVAFDPSSTVLAVASNDGTVKMLEMGNACTTLLTAHEDAAQAVVFDRRGQFLVSAGSDATFRIWS